MLSTKPFGPELNKDRRIVDLLEISMNIIFTYYNTDECMKLNKLITNIREELCNDGQN